MRVQQLIQQLMHVFHTGGESDLDTSEAWDQQGLKYYYSILPVSSGQ